MNQSDGRTWTRRAVLASVAMVAFVVGLALGLLLRPISASWFEAVGTWVGALVSTTAVILAVIVFRSEDFMRRMDQARQTRAEETARRNELARAQREADLVIISTGWSSSATPDGKVRVNWFDRSVRNSSSTQTVTQVEYRHPLFQPEFALIAHVLSPLQDTGLHGNEVGPFEIDQDISGLDQLGEVRFQADGRSWQKRGNEPATLVIE